MSSLLPVRGSASEVFTPHKGGSRGKEGKMDRLVHCAVIQTHNWGDSWFLYYWACDYAKFEHEHFFPMRLVGYIPHGGVTGFCSARIHEPSEQVVFQDEQELVKWVSRKVAGGRHQYDRVYVFVEEVVKSPGFQGAR